LAILVGGATGVISMLPWTIGEISLPQGLAALAGVAGAAGSGLAMAVWRWTYGPAPYATWDRGAHAKPSVLGRVFRLSVFALVMAGWPGLFHWYEEWQAASRREECEEKLEDIAHCLHGYVEEHKSLPPAYLTDKEGHAVLSWRVRAAQFSDNYSSTSSSSLDFSKPWNDPKNAVCLVYVNPEYDLENSKWLANHDRLLYHCPGSFKGLFNPLTDYVAVVGPDTLWPGKTPGDLKRHPKAILVVEWPKSDIHWAEPRDITVGEFLDWFRVKPPHRGLWDWFCARPAPGDGFHCGGLLYVDAEGKVGQLPRDTDPETVRKLLAGQASVATASPVPSGR
jgi:hypothetical protein